MATIFRSKTINYVFIGIGGFLLLFYVAFVLFGSSIYMKPDIREIVKSWAGLAMSWGIILTVFNVFRIIVKSLRDQDLSGTVKTGVNSFFIGAGSVFLSGALVYFKFIVIDGESGDIIAATITFAIIALLMIAPSISKIKKKIRDANYRYRR